MERSLRNWKLKIGLFFVTMMVLMVFAVMYLWNYLMPSIFGLPEITLLQTVAMLILSRILFGQWGKGHKRHGSWRQRKHWMHKMKDKWEEMTPEERAQAKDKWGWSYPEAKIASENPEETK